MKSHHQRSWVARLVIVLLIHSSLLPLTAQAGMITTGSAISAHSVELERARLLQAVNADAVQERLLALGVDSSEVEQRIASLSAAELAELNQQVDELAAGQGVGGVLLTLFIVFIVTDMLCATDLFSFVSCINK